MSNKGTYPGFTARRGLAPGATFPEIKRLYFDGTSLTLNASHVDTALVCRAATAVTITLPANLGLKDGAAIHIFQYGAGQVTVTAGTGITLRAAVSAKTRAQYSVISLMQIDGSLGLWSSFGDMG